jgi:hypothetical protein
MLIFQPPVNFCSDENIQTIFGIKLKDFLNYRIDYNLISQTVEKVVKKIFFRAPKSAEIKVRRAAARVALDQHLTISNFGRFWRAKNIFFTTFSTVYDIEL